MRAVFTVAVELRGKVGCVGIVVDAKPGAESYYSRYGFVELEAVEGMLEERPTPKPMILPLSAIVRAVGAVRAKKHN
jgi:hypothetical protein